MYGALYLVCPDIVWSALAKNQIQPAPHTIGPVTLRPRPIHLPPPPVKLLDSSRLCLYNTALRALSDAEARAEASLLRVLIASIGESQCLLLEQAGSDLLDLTAMDIIQAMRAEHGVLEPANLVKKRAGLHSKLSSVELFP